MKVPFSLIAFAALCCFSVAADLELKDGRVLPDYRIMSHDADSVTIRYKGGAIKAEKVLIPDEILEKHHISLPTDEQYESYDPRRKDYVTKTKPPPPPQPRRRARESEERREAPAYTPPTPKSYVVEYELRGSSNVVHATYESASGTKQEHLIPNHGWRYQWNAKSGDFAYFSIQLDRYPGDTRIVLKVNGEVVKENSVRDRHNIATVSYGLP